jgi:hypothetical protein
MLSDDEIQLALRCAREGGLDMALAMVNDLREKERRGYDGVPPEPKRLSVVWSTVQAAVKSRGAQCHRRQSRKTGSRDEFSRWAIFRYHFAMQVDLYTSPPLYYNIHVYVSHPYSSSATGKRRI